MTENIEKISKIIPIFSILILFSSIIRNFIFYQYFGININEYIGLSEFTLLFINDLAFYLISILSFLIYLPFIYVKDYFRRKYSEEILRFTNTKKIAKTVMVLAVINSILIFIIDFPLDIQLYFLQTFIIAFFASLLLWLDKSIEFSKKYSLIFISSLLIIFPIIKAFTDINNIENEKPYNEIIFNYNNKQIQSNKYFLFLGKTNEYLFLYNKSTKYTEVFKMSEINNLKIRKL
ncbi:hypothetical protein REB14_18860 [Chryseobacterium sp. ES2]|uniref:Uncharacterized protein n=1 Tax=Chryseobacterium metallicongregator TaxID=3073042 RepID=A0ABU1E909_9FLAO|nr:hypothetical protein [Chryseobacterium sp. ES2]MDR4954246.1 hypothetical protein [Chryseobacterium sp. ES2]